MLTSRFVSVSVILTLLAIILACVIAFFCNLIPPPLPLGLLFVTLLIATLTLAALNVVIPRLSTRLTIRIAIAASLLGTVFAFAFLWNQSLVIDLPPRMVRGSVYQEDIALFLQHESEENGRTWEDIELLAITDRTLSPEQRMRQIWTERSIRHNEWTLASLWLGLVGFTVTAWFAVQHCALPYVLTPKDLDGVKQGDVFRAIMQGFNRSSLHNLLLHRMDVQIEHIARDGTLVEIITDVVKWADKEDRLDELIAYAHQEIPSNLKIAELFAKYAPAAEGPHGGDGG